MKLRLMLAMVLMAACTDSVFASVSTEAATALARRILGEQCDRIRFQDVSRNKADAEFSPWRIPAAEFLSAELARGDGYGTELVPKVSLQG